jgi:quercetin dioxygenase-like cupin family protein
MEKEILKTKPRFRRVSRAMNEPSGTFDFPTLIEKMKHTDSWAKGELNAMVLLKNPNKQIVLTALHEGTEIESFQSNHSITFQIIEGKLRFHSPKESLILDKGQLLTLRENIKYDLTSKEETVFLLTITKGKLQKTESTTLWCI